MELRLVIFLAFVSVTVVANTIAVFIAYRLFAGMTFKATEAVTQFRKNTESREWIDSLKIAAERAAVITESTKVKIAEFDPVLTRAQENYRQTLVDLDSKLEATAEKITTTAREVRDTIAKPAFAAATFVAGMARAMDRRESED